MPMPIFMRFRKLEPYFSDMVDFGTFWTDCRENSHHPVTSLRSVMINFGFNVREMKTMKPLLIPFQLSEGSSTLGLATDRG